MSNLIRVGSLVWFDANVGYLLPGKVLSIAGKDVRVQHELTGDLHTVRGNGIIPRQEVGVHGMDDMIKMDDLHVGSILYNIRERYRQDQIYTYIGSILLAVNPYMQYRIYGPDAVKRYSRVSTASEPPHIYAIANAAFQSLLRTDHKQAIVISGESGAGKTESARLLIEFLAANQADGSLVINQIVEATPLLESFGNAKTVKNDNSSRFGKYFEIYYDSFGKICGGRISEYLLERSRIVGQAPGERNYHIFYEMMSGLTDQQKQKFGLTTVEEFAYLNQGNATVIPHREEDAYFHQVLKAMDILGISGSEKEAIFKVLSIVLHLGNVNFGKTEASGQEAAVILRQAQVTSVSQLLGVEMQQLDVSLTQKETTAGGSPVRSPRTRYQAIEARDALAKQIYNHLFAWLIGKVNSVIFRGKLPLSIAVLDIFGFENFETNSFEQLCINFANETLQFFFNQFVFRMEQDEYANEGIQWTSVQFFDNQPRLDLLAKPPHGLIHILAEASGFPKADDYSFLEKCHYHHEQSKFYGKPKTPKPEFAVIHYAGTVWYKVAGFLEKNRDGLRPDLEDLIARSGNQFIQELFPELQSAELTTQGLKLPSQPKNSLRLPMGQKKKPTVCGKFNESLIKLVVAMKSCNPFFVRCIKPNNTKVPGLFETALVVEQLRSFGIVETVKVRKTGYPIRYLYGDFLKRYQCLSSKLDLSSPILTENVARVFSIIDRVQADSYQFGRTKVFLKESLHLSLEDARMAKLNRMAVVLQARMRGYYLNSKYLKMKKAAIVIQSNTRRMVQRKKFLKARKGFILLQAIHRMKHQRQAFIKIRNESRNKKAVLQAVPPPPTPPTEEEVILRSPHDLGESEKQIAVDVTQLDIPAELALVFANIQGWSLAHGNSVKEKNGEIIKCDFAKTKLPEDINEFPFSKFAQEQFQSEHQWRMVRSPIRTSLLQVKYSDNVLATGLFQLVMRFMDDESIAGPKDFAVGNYLVQMGIFRAELRDEMYSHVCNQTWGNHSDASNERGWLLLALFLCCFAPSARLYNHILKYASDHAFDGYKSYCQHKLLCWDINGSPVSRCHPPSLLEWQAAKVRGNMAGECHLPDGERRTAELESCTTGEEFAGLILEDRGIDNPKGWSVDLETTSWHSHLSGADYVLDLISELEYPPAFPLSQSSSLVTLKLGHDIAEGQLKTLSNLHTSQPRGKNVAELANKFTFVERQQSAQVQREDALSAATTARLAQASQPKQVADGLVQRTRLGSASSPGPVGQVFVPPPPPPPPAFMPPPPPPPPPVAPPPSRLVLKEKRSGDVEKKKRDSGPQLSMAEVVAKAKKMRETRERVLSTDGSASANQDTSDDPFESAMQARSVHLKSRRVEVQQTPRQEEESELKREMRRKAKRASLAFVENEKVTQITIEDGVFQAGYDRKPTRAFSSSTSSRETGDNDSLQSLENAERLESPKEVNDFVDSLFDPVLSQGVEGLSNTHALRGALKGGGGVNQPSSTTAANSLGSGTPITTTAVNGHPVSQGNGYLAGQPNGYPIAGQLGGYAIGPANGFPIGQANGFPAGQLGGFPVVSSTGNGYPGLTQATGFSGMLPVGMYYGLPQANGPLLPSGNMDAAMLAAQQQILIERLIATQKQQEQLLQLAQQRAQLEQMQLLLANAGQQPQSPTVQTQATAAALLQGLNSPPSTTSTLSSSTVNGHEELPKKEPTIAVPLPPPEFSDLIAENGLPIAPVLPPPSSLPSPPPVPTTQQSFTASDAFPAPPSSIVEPRSAVGVDSVDSPQRPELKRRSTDKVALAVAALESKAEDVYSPGDTSPLKHAGEKFTFEAPAKERPGIQKRQSSAVGFVLLTDKQSNTVRHPRSSGPYLTYSNVKWKFNIRKEIFMAEEKVNNNLVQRLIFLQIVRDSYSHCCCKMSNDDCQRMQMLLQKYNITPERPHSSSPVEGIVIEAARQLPLYFSRFFVVKGQNELPDVHFLAVSEHGLKLVKRDKISDELEIVRSIPYSELVKTKAVKDKLTLTLAKDVKIVFLAERASEIKQLTDTYLRQLEMEVKYVRALYDHVSSDPALLTFKKGDVIKLVPKDGLKDGWVFGVFNNQGGYFPDEFVTHIKEDPQVPRPSGGLKKAASAGSLLNLDPNMQLETRSRTDSVKSEKSDENSGKYSMMEFAMKYFRFGREAVVRGEDGTIRGTVKVKGTLNRSSKANHKKEKAAGWTWGGLAELVKYSRVPIQASLLMVESPQLNKHAVETFQLIMKFMWDLPLSKHQKETDVVFNLLKMCRDIQDLSDEVYCQLIKQVTSNKSLKPESCGRGWRLMIIITAYVKCSDHFEPYLVHFLQTTASDPKREFHGAAATCEMNLMKSFKYGGRKTPPSKDELNQLVQGRQTKRQVFLLPGCTRMLKVQTSSTGYDVIKEICCDMDLPSESHYKEYGLFTFMEGENVMVPVKVTDYIMDVVGTMERQGIKFSLCFRRVLWLQGLRLDNELLVSVIYYQVLPDFMAGYLLATHGRSFNDPQFQNQIAELGALQYRARDETVLPSNLSEVETLIPRGVFQKLRPQQWTILIQDHFRSCHSLSPHQARRTFLETVTKWPYFGSTFFEVKNCSHPAVGGDCVLAVNRTGVHFLNHTTAQTLHSEPFMSIISTRLLISDKRRQFLDLKIGNQMMQKVTRMETTQAKEISSLVYKYVEMYSSAKQEGQGPAVVPRNNQEATRA